MAANIRALITVNTERFIPDYLVITVDAQRCCWAARNTVVAMLAVIDGMGVMAAKAVEIASLQKENQAIARSIHAGKR